MTPSAQTDINSLLEEAFEDCECCFDNEVSHEGGKSAYFIGHGCVDGFVCRAHFRHLIDVVMPGDRRVLDRNGHITCAVCLQPFFSVDSFWKVYPL